MRKLEDEKLCFEPQTSGLRTTRSCDLLRLLLPCTNMLPTMSAMQEKLLSQNCLHALHCQPLRLRCRHARRASTFFCNAQRASSKAPCCDRHASSNKLAAEVHQVASMQPDRRALISAALLLSATVPVAALAGETFVLKLDIREHSSGSCLQDCRE